MGLTDIKTVKTIMERHGLHFQKKFGQNFLINPMIPERISAECGAEADAGILEIGPGIGTLSQYLAQDYQKLVAVEIDRALIPVLHETLADFDNVTIIEGDILQTDLVALFDAHFHGMPVTVCANLPYYITTPIIMKLLEARLPINHITIMIQKEVADRLCAKPGSSDYGAITAAVRYFSQPEKLFGVTKGNFLPAPKVDSAVVRLSLYQTPPIAVASEALLFRVIRAAFAQRRKTLSNALTAAFGSIPKDEICQMLHTLGFPADIRGERLDVADFAKIADEMNRKLTNHP